MSCLIFCGGAIDDYGFIKRYMQGAELVLCVDSGARHCRKLQVTPDFLIGDFDSISEDDFSALAEAGVPIIRYPAEKDMTDSELAVQTACDRGCKSVILLGAIGSRLDHSLSNLFLLKKMADLNVEGMIANEYNEVMLINGSITLEREEGTFITLLPLAGSAKGVTTEGLYFPLADATLEVGSSWGVSNKFADNVATVTVKEGYLLVIKSRD